jgi:hypothetical protein
MPLNRRPALNPGCISWIIGYDRWHNQNIDIQRTQYLLGNAPKQQFHQPRAAVSSNYQQIGSRLLNGM